MSDKLPSVVRMRTRDGSDHGLMEVAGMYTGPTYTGSGTWLVELCEELDPKEEAAYWREQCEKARQQRDEAIDKLMDAQTKLIEVQDDLIREKNLVNPFPNLKDGEQVFP